MHSFQPSRGRILFEVFCALAVVASMVGAWRQTDASALLTAAGAAALYAMVRLFDLGRREPAQVEEPQRIAFEPQVLDEAPVNLAAELAPVALEPRPPAEVGFDEIAIAEPAPARPEPGRRKGGSRKGNGRRASAPKKVKVAELATAEPIQVEAVALPEDPLFADPASAADPEAAEFAPQEPIAHVPHAPLFEPEPFVRMPRQAFGRRGRI